MAKTTLSTLNQLKSQQEPFACLTAYDYSLAHAISSQGVEVLLVGDSLGMVMQGHSSTLPVTLDDICYHTRCVKQGNQSSLLMVDMPMLYYANEALAFDSCRTLMQNGAEVIKLEGQAWLAPIITKLADNGVPVCAHLGLTPQSVHKFGGFKVQGRSEEDADKLIEDAIALEKAGAAIILVECIPASLTERLMKSVSIPVIGIGAGPQTDGQILVIQDLLGLTPGKTAKFVKNFLAEADSAQSAIQLYREEVKARTFPSEQHCFNA